MWGRTLEGWHIASLWSCDLFVVNVLSVTGAGFGLTYNPKPQTILRLAGGSALPRLSPGRARLSASSGSRSCAITSAARRAREGRPGRSKPRAINHRACCLLAIYIFFDCHPVFQCAVHSWL